MNYERTREKILKKIGIVHSPSKIWKSSAVDSRSNQWTSEKEARYIELLNTSHDTNSEYSRAVEDFFEFFEKFKENLALIIDGDTPSPLPRTLKAQDLDDFSLTDLCKYSELTAKERNKLEFYYTDFFQLTKELNSQLVSLQDKLDSAQSSVHNLESQLASLSYKTQKDAEESEQRLQELLETCHDYNEQIERLKKQVSEKAPIRKSFEIEKKNSCYIEMMSKLENQVHELNKDLANRDKRIEKLTETIQKFEESQLEHQTGSERFQDEVFELEHRNRELSRLIEAKNNDLAKTLDNLRFMQEELARCKLKDSKNKENKDCQDLKSQNSSLKTELNDYRSKANDYKEEMLIYKSQCIEYKKENKQLKKMAKGEDSQVLARLAEIIHKICEEYSQAGTSEFKNSEGFSETFKEINFIAELLEKMAYDNNWLVDQMEELGQENQILREEMSQSKVLGRSFSNLHQKTPAYQDSPNDEIIFTLSD